MSYEIGEDAVAPLDGSIFEPKTPFPYAGLIHNPGTQGSADNKGREGNGADMIEVSHAVVVDEIAKGLHGDTGRPNSALLNHCKVFKASPESRQILVDFYATVTKRTSARQRRRVEEKKKSMQTKYEVKEETFGVADAPGNVSAPPVKAARPVKNKGGRPKGSKSKAKQTVERIVATT